MASEIHPGNERSFTVSYSRIDGPGEVEFPPVASLSDESLAKLVVADDGMSGVVQHNGGVGEVTLTVRADGDLGIGEFPIVLSHVFPMMPPRGATGGGLGVGDERPIRPPV